MSAAIIQASEVHRSAPAQIGEWFWRFLAVVMLAVIGWVVWIAIQISPPDMVLPAAYEAAAQGRAVRNTAGAISGAPGEPNAQAAMDPMPAGATPVPVAATAPLAWEPPVNLEKLKLAESIETPILERGRRPAKPAGDVIR